MSDKKDYIQKAWVLSGLPGSGKTTWAKKRTSLKTVIISRDSIREMLSGKYKVNSKLENLVLQIAKKSVSLALKEGFNIIIDETCLTKKTRLRWLKLIKKINKRCRCILVIFPETKNNLKFRMRSPKGLSKRVWQRVINKMKKIMQEPSLKEGWDLIIKKTTF